MGVMMRYQRETDAYFRKQNITFHRRQKSLRCSFMSTGKVYRFIDKTPISMWLNF